jgi:hypothetical protein
MFRCFDASLPNTPGVSLDALVLAGLVLAIVVCRARLPEWLFPLKGRWLRGLLTGLVLVCTAVTCLTLLTSGFVYWPLGMCGVADCLPW